MCKESYVKAYEGRAMAAIVADGPGEITVKAWVEGLEAAEIKIEAK